MQQPVILDYSADRNGLPHHSTTLESKGITDQWLPTDSIREGYKNCSKPQRNSVCNVVTEHSERRTCL